MKFKYYLNEAKVAVHLFDVESAAEVVNKIKKGVKAPFVNAQFSTLGGPQNVSILVVVSIDEKETWANKIMENSRMFRIHLTLPNIMEMFQKSYTIKTKFRKARPKSIDDVIKRINDFIKKASAEKQNG